MPLLECRRLTRTFPMEAGPLTVLSDINLTVESGEYIAITGPSGSGKSTLLNILGCLDQPTAGEYILSPSSSVLEK